MVEMNLENYIYLYLKRNIRINRDIPMVTWDPYVYSYASDRLLVVYNTVNTNIYRPIKGVGEVAL